jgi:hypothetical protein
MRYSAFYLCIITALLLSACSGNYGIQKRKYTRGYYLAWSGKKQADGKREVVKRNASVAAVTLPAEEVLTTNVVPVEPELLTVAGSFIPSKPAAQTRLLHPKIPGVSRNEPEKDLHSSDIKPAQKNQVKEQDQQQRGLLGFIIKLLLSLIGIIVLIVVLVLIFGNR